MLACFGCTMMPCYKDSDEVVYFKSDGRPPLQGSNNRLSINASGGAMGTRTGSINQEEDF